MRSTRFWPVLVPLALLACGESVSPSGHGSDAATTLTSDASPDVAGGTILGACSASGECPANSLCLFAIGTCSATGQCIENPPSECKSLQYLCGCDGTTVAKPCFTTGALGPTTGAPSRTDNMPGEPDFCTDGGTAPPSDASGFVDANTCTICEASCQADPVCISMCGC
jgi:hypothetical protein